MTRLKHRIPVILVAIALAVLLSAGWSRTWMQSAGGDEELSLTATNQVFPEDGLDEFMKKKLSAINLAMKAAAKDDFKGVENAGIELIRLSKDAAWNRRADAEYLQDTSDFIASVRFMVRMADSEDTLGVASSYAAVSACCLSCHRHVRSPKIAAHQPSHGGRVVMLLDKNGYTFDTSR